MNARMEIRDALIVRKMRRWQTIALYPSAGKGCPAWRARKNYWALQRKHAALAARHGLIATSVL
jgi:hypothetical protein